MQRLRETWLLLVGTIALISSLAGLFIAFPGYGQLLVGALAVLLILFYVGLRLRDFLQSLPLNPKDPNTLLTGPLSPVDTQQAIRVLRDKLVKENFIPDVIIGVDRGGAICGGMLSKMLSRPVVHISSSQRWTISSAEDSIDDGLKDYTKRREPYRLLSRLLVVDDASRTGSTLAAAVECLKKLPSLQGIEIKTAVILNEERKIGPHQKQPPDFWAYRTGMANIPLPWDAHLLE